MVEDLAYRLESGGPVVVQNGDRYLLASVTWDQLHNLYLSLKREQTALSNRIGNYAAKSDTHKWQTIDELMEEYAQNAVLMESLEIWLKS